MNHQTSTILQVIPQVTYQSPQAPTHLITEPPFVNSSFAVSVFSLGDNPIACLNKAMAFITSIASSSNATSSRENTTSGHARVVKCYNCQGEGHMARQCTQPKRPRNAAWNFGRSTQTIIPHNAAFQTEDLDTCDSDCDDLSTAQAVLMANISNYGSDVISEVSNSKTYLNDMDNQSVHALQDFEQTPVMDFTDSEISSDSNIIPYS
ncbi:retrovirus-related pol polyprotein from transposon TNT 1-94 [Tanacetum coccineum]|uniref:Retrovirus-related pol polyprotein from transposon TNT 1-94 n=1 Tax=Tanacetum coccineum TaxID=301880 RepID=A0ABQ5AW28_9ASTR